MALDTPTHRSPYKTHPADLATHLVSPLKRPPGAPASVGRPGIALNRALNLQPQISVAVRPFRTGHGLQRRRGDTRTRLHNSNNVALLRLLRCIQLRTLTLLTGRNTQLYFTCALLSRFQMQGCKMLQNWEIWYATKRARHNLAVANQISIDLMQHYLYDVA
jgi:hypothetical protein